MIPLGSTRFSRFCCYPSAKNQGQRHCLNVLHDKHRDQKQLGEKGFIGDVSRVTWSIAEESQGRNSGQELIEGSWRNAAY